MIYRDHTYPEKVNVAMRGGDGQVRVESLLTKEEMYEKGRLFGRLTLEPGCSIGQHEHNGEMETFYVPNMDFGQWQKRLDALLQTLG